RQTLMFGGRVQGGPFETHNEISTVPSSLQLPTISRTTVEQFRRAAGYAYYTFVPARDFSLTAGLAYDSVDYPANFRHPPISAGESSRSLFSPKAAVVYSPAEWVTLRGAYARSLGGVSLDQSYRLEPTHLAGFVQTF